MNQQIAISHSGSIQAGTSDQQFITVNVEKRIAKITGTSFDKILRKKNVIVRGLEIRNLSPARVASEFFAQHFTQNNCVSEAVVIGRCKDGLKVKLSDMFVKNKIIVEKKKLPAPIYIDHDLTCEEEIIAKKLRDAGRQLKKEG